MTFPSLTISIDKAIAKQSIMLARVTPNILKVSVSIVKAINKHQFFKYALECFNGDSKLPWLFIVFDLENKDSIKSKRNKRKSDINLGTQLI